MGSLEGSFGGMGIGSVPITLRGKTGENERTYPQFTGTEPCTQVDSEIFYQESYDRDMLKLLRSMCGRCDLQVECLEYSLTEDFGFWAGYTAHERAMLARRRRRFSRAKVLDAAVPQQEWRR